MKHRTVYSFDLFDTVLSRKTGTPKGIFCIMRELLTKQAQLEKKWIETFYDLRIQAEKTARENAAGEEISLMEIYQTMKENHPEIPAETLAELEMETEQTYSFGIRETVNTIHFLLDLGKRVVFISDMYLPLPLIREMLHGISPRLSGLPVYLSSEEGVMKQTGNLFRHVLEKENLAPEELLHTGDNLWADQQVPEGLGIRTHAYTGSALLAPEKLMLLREDSLYAQLMCGASRFTRLTAHDSSDIYRTGTTFSGPLFYTCVRPVLARAAGMKNTKIQFMARDGNVLKIVADEILSVHPLPVRTGYLHTSRETLFLPAIREVSEHMFQSLRNRLFFDSQETLRSLFRKLSLPEQAMREIADKTGIRTDQKLQKRQQEKLLRQLSRSRYGADIQTICRKKRLLLLEYLKENDFFHSANLLFDIGWSGESLKAFREILHDIPVVCAGILCFGAPLKAEETSVEYQTRLTSEELYHCNPALELFCQANHGRTVGYEAGEGTIHPILTPVSSRYLSWPFERYDAGLRDFSRNFTHLIQNLPEREMEMETSIRKNLLKILKNPPRFIADAVGRILYIQGFFDEEIREAAPPFTWKTLIQYLLCRDRNITSWYEGSLARSDLFFIRLNTTFFLLIRKMTNIFIWLKRDGIAATCREAIRQLKTMGRKG